MGTRHLVNFRDLAEGPWPGAGPLSPFPRSPNIPSWDKVSPLFQEGGCLKPMSLDLLAVPHPSREKESPSFKVVMATASERVPLLGQAPECRGAASRGAAQSPEPVARY